MAVASVAVVTCGLVGGGVAVAHGGGESSGSGAVEAERHGTPWRAHGARGTVASVAGTSFVLDAKNGSTVDVATTDTTTFAVVSQGTVADATVGSYVVVYGRSGDDGVLNAKWLTLKPQPDATASAYSSSWHWRHGVAGVVAAYDPTTGALTVTTDEGPVTVATGADTKVKSIVAGSLADVVPGATVNVNGDRADDGTLTARRVKIFAPATVEPLPIEPVVSTTVVPVETPTTAAPTTTTEAPPATPTPPPEETGLRGTVTEVLGTTLTVATRDGGTVTVLTDGATRFGVKDCDRRGDDSGDAPASLADVVVGSDVKIKGVVNADGTVTATAVLLDDDDGDGRGDRDGAWDDGDHRGKWDHHDEDGEWDRHDDEGGDWQGGRRDSDGGRGGEGWGGRDDD
jgi:hypothetical protein